MRCHELQGSCFGWSAEYYLPTKEKLIFLLYYKHGYSSKEISELIGCHRNTVLRNLGRIGRKLSSYINNKNREVEVARASKIIKKLALAV